MKTLLLVNAGSQYLWGELIRTDDETYSIPVYVCEILHGKHKGDTVGVAQYYDIRKV